MIAEFKHTLWRMRGSIIGWGIGLALYGLLMASFYDTIQGIEGIEDFLSNYPPELLAFFGDMLEITTPAGYLGIYYFSYMTPIIGIFAISAGARLLVGDEESGTLDLVLAHPVSRTALFWGRTLGLMAATALILLVSWLSWVIPSASSGLDLTWLEFLRPFVPLLAELVLFGTLALLLSMVLPSARMAGMVCGAFLIASFLLLGLANINPDLQPVVELTPLYYYQGGDAIAGIDWTWFAGLVGAALVFALAAWGLFHRRDIRVGGEHSWRFSPALLSRRRGGS
jgi:ABC-2 type transport system permease protein